MKCYGLPYGALGFVSHILTCYAVFCSFTNRKPIWPLSKAEYGIFAKLCTIVVWTFSAIYEGITVERCLNTWQLLGIAVWKFFLSTWIGWVALGPFGDSEQRSRRFFDWFWVCTWCPPSKSLPFTHFSWSLSLPRAGSWDSRIDVPQSSTYRQRRWEGFDSPPLLNFSAHRRFGVSIRFLPLCLQTLWLCQKG